MRKVLVFFTAFIVMAAFAGIASGAATDTPNTVRVTGTGIFKRNALVAETLSFQPGSISVTSGSEITFVNAAGSDPHTVTIVDKSARPSSFDEVFQCGSSKKDPCGAALAAHFPKNAPPVVQVDTDSTPGLSAVGDSLLLCPNPNLQQETCDRGSVGWVVSAPAGSTLYYLCAIHPWMQGVIKVK
jgi:plastocyanin